jgi:hypothetical protein
MVLHLTKIWKAGKFFCKNVNQMNSSSQKFRNTLVKLHSLSKIKIYLGQWPLLLKNPNKHWSYNPCFQKLLFTLAKWPPLSKTKIYLGQIIPSIKKIIFTVFKYPPGSPPPPLKNLPWSHFLQSSKSFRIVETSSHNPEKRVPDDVVQTLICKIIK